MRPIERPRAPAARPGPGPSKLNYRLERAWAKPWLRAMVTVYLPIGALGLLGFWAASLDPVRLAVEERVERLSEAFAARPEFTIKGIEIVGAEPGLEGELHDALAPVSGRSSIRLDLEALRKRIEEVDAVRWAEVRVDAGGIMRIRLEARVPAALWRDGEGVHRLVDAEGVVIGETGARDHHPALPLLIGEGAAQTAGEALALMAAAPDLVPRIIAFVRVGQRRWTVSLTDGKRILLPEEGAAAALARVMAWHYGEELLDREASVIDMRLPGRPTVRLTPYARDKLDGTEDQPKGEGEDI